MKATPESLYETVPREELIAGLKDATERILELGEQLQSHLVFLADLRAILEDEEWSGDELVAQIIAHVETFYETVVERKANGLRSRK